MKILLIAPRLPHARVVSGHQIVYQRLMTLVRAGHDVGLICYESQDDAAYVADMRAQLCDLERVPQSFSSMSAAGFAPRWAYYTGAHLFRRRFSRTMQRCIGDVAERGRYEVVLAEFAYIGQHLYRNPYLPAVRSIISVHRSPMLEVLKMRDMARNPVRRALLRWAFRNLRRFETALYRSVDRVLVLSAEERYRLLTRARDLRVHVVPGGVDAEFFKPSRETRENAVVTTGDYEDPANTDAVLWFVRNVWRNLRRHHPDLLFYVIGPNPPESLLALTRKDPRIIVSGWVADVRPYLAKAKIFVCPQRIGSGVRGKLLEAMAMDLPLVTTSLGAEGIPIHSGETGFIADTPELFAQYINLLLEDVALRDSMGQRARQLAAERFSWKRSGELLERVLRELTESASEIGV